MTSRLVTQGQTTSGLSRARQRRAGCDPGQITTNQEVGVRDRSVPKTRHPRDRTFPISERTGMLVIADERTVQEGASLAA